MQFSHNINTTKPVVLSGRAGSGLSSLASAAVQRCLTRPGVRAHVASAAIVRSPAAAARALVGPDAPVRLVLAAVGVL